MERFKFYILLTTFLALTACTTTGPSTSFQSLPPYYEEKAFQQAVEEEKTIFLNFFAPWCNVCVGNEQALVNALEQIPEELEEDFTAFTVDFDDSDGLRDQFGISFQPGYVLIPKGDIEKFYVLGPGSFDEEDFLEFIINPK